MNSLKLRLGQHSKIDLQNNLQLGIQVKTEASFRKPLLTANLRARFYNLVRISSAAGLFLFINGFFSLVGSPHTLFLCFNFSTPPPLLGIEDENTAVPREATRDITNCWMSRACVECGCFEGGREVKKKEKRWREMVR